MCQLAIANNDRQKKVFACPIRHLLEQKFRIILNIVLIVNEFECFVLFPAAPIFLFCLLCCAAAVVALCRSPKRDFDSVGSLLFASFFVRHLLFLFLPRSTHFSAEPQQKTLEAAWKKISYVHNRESEREKKKKNC